MNIQEFSNEFDTLFNNISSNQAPGIDEYEKSVFLTKAQYQLINEFFNGRTDGFGGGFDGSQKRQYDFSSLLANVDLIETPSIHKVIDKDEYSINEITIAYPASGKTHVFGPIDIKLKYPKVRLYVGFLNSRNEETVIFPFGPATRAMEDAVDYWGFYSASNVSNGVASLILLLNPLGKPTNSPDQQEIDDLWAHFCPSTIGANANLSGEAVAGMIAYKFSTYISSCICEGENPEYNIYTEDTDDAEEISGTLFINNAEFSITYREEPLDVRKFDIRSKLYTFPSDYFLSVNEVLQQTNSPYNTLTVRPLSYSEYSRLMLKPYQYPVKKAAWRLITLGQAEDFNDGGNTSSVDGEKPFNASTTVEIIGRNIDDYVYKLRYVKRPTPIILEDLTGTGLSIEGYTRPQTSALPPSCHQEILERAVTLAKIAWQGGTLTQAQSARDKE